MAIMAMAIFNSNMIMIDIPQKSTKKLFHNVKIAHASIVKHRYFRQLYIQKSNISEIRVQKREQIQAVPVPFCLSLMYNHCVICLLISQMYQGVCALTLV